MLKFQKVYICVQKVDIFGILLLLLKEIYSKKSIEMPITKRPREAATVVKHFMTQI